MLQGARVKARYLIAGGAALFAAGVGTGLLARPARVETHTVEVAKDRVVYQDRVVERQVAATETHEVTRWRTRVVTRPDGTKVETREAVAGKAAASSATSERAQAQASERVSERVVVHDRIVEGARPRWLLGAGAGLDLSGHPHYAGLVSYRLVGPLALAVTVDLPARAAVLFAGLVF